MRLVLLSLAGLATLAGCASSAPNTVTVGGTTVGGAEVPEYRVEVPAGYDVRSVDYDAAGSGRGVVAVYAVHRATGREVVFVYDDVRGGAAPSAVIRLARPSGR